MQVPGWIRQSRWLSAKRRLEWYPPFRAMSVEVLELGADWRSARLRLPLNGFTRNPGGSMFGGAVAALADPIPALSCNRVFPGHLLWTRSLRLDFLHEARTDLELRFELLAPQEQEIREQLQSRGRATPAFEFGFHDTHGRLCVSVHNSVAIRPMGYRPQGKSDE